MGWLGNATFFSRFFVQWYATEKLKRVVVPTNRRYSAAVTPTAALAHRCRAMRRHSRMHPLMSGIVCEPLARFAFIASGADIRMRAAGPECEC